MSKQVSHSPQSTRFMLIIMFILGVYQILFAYRVLQDSGIHPEDLSLAPVVQSVIAVIWGITFSYTSIRLWRGIHRAILESAWLLIGFIVFQFLQVAVFVQADYQHNRLVFTGAVALIILILPVAIMIHHWQRGTHN